MDKKDVEIEKRLNQAERAIMELRTNLALVTDSYIAALGKFNKRQEKRLKNDDKEEVKVESEEEMLNRMADNLI
jgi:hypothetical protein